MDATKDCGHFGCNVRAARGLKRFCEMGPETVTGRPGNEFSSYAAACEYRSVAGGKIHCNNRGFGYNTWTVTKEET